MRNKITMRNLRIFGTSYTLALMLGWIVTSVVVSMPACAKAPPTLVTSQGIAAFQNLQVLKAIDLVRDVAQDASRTSPPMLTRDVALKVTNWHTAAVKILDARTAGWKEAIPASLDAVVKTLAQKDQDMLRPYVALVKTLLLSFGG